MITYLGIINKILIRLREDQVTDLSDTYIDLLGEFVNDAKEQVEDAWDWSALQASYPINTIGGTAQYALVGSSDRTSIEQVLDLTSKAPLTVMTKQELAVYNMSNPSQDRPTKFVINGRDSNGDQLVTLSPTPNATYTLNFNGFTKQAELVATTDALLVPKKPVVSLAFAMAARERGEVGGQTALELFGIAKRVLSDTIAIDAQLTPDQLIFEAV